MEETGPVTLKIMSPQIYFCSFSYLPYPTIHPVAQAQCLEVILDASLSLTCQPDLQIHPKRKGHCGLKSGVLSGRRGVFLVGQRVLGFGNQESTCAKVGRKDQAWLVWRPETSADLIEHQLYASYCQVLRLQKCIFLPLKSLQSAMGGELYL